MPGERTDGMKSAGIVVLVASSVLVVVGGVAGRWQYWGGDQSGAKALRAVALGFAGVAAGVLLLALADR